MLTTAFLLGFVGSLHCVGMCGPIAFMLPLDRKRPVKSFFQLISYHLGRIFTYSLIGVLFGLLGKSFYFFGFQQQLSIAIGLLMIIAIIFPKIFKKLTISNKITAILIKVKSALGKELKKQDNSTLFTIGFLNGFLPCGLVYMAVFGAIALGNPLSGALYMALFGIGTIPLMTAVIYIGNFTKGNLRLKIQKAIPVLVVFVGVLFVLRGLGLGIPYISPQSAVATFDAVSGCH